MRARRGEPVGLPEVMSRLEALADPAAAAGMAAYGIKAKQVLGVKVPDLRTLAAEIGTDHALALALWAVEARETRILASMVAEPTQTDDALMEGWASAFDSWEICDQCCMNLFERLPAAYAKASAWSGRSEEFVKRAGFVLMARLAVSDKKAPDDRFVPFLDLVKREAGDDRPMVKKGVNWALRQIGKRNSRLNAAALGVARELAESPSSAARRVASDAIRELTDPAIQARVIRR